MRSIGFDTKPLKHFDATVRNAEAIYSLANTYPDSDDLRRIANSCRDTIRAGKTYEAERVTTWLLAKARQVSLS